MLILMMELLKPVVLTAGGTMLIGYGLVIEYATRKLGSFLPVKATLRAVSVISGVLGALVIVEGWI